jgi:hypothetical protein
VIVGGIVVAAMIIVGAILIATGGGGSTTSTPAAHDATTPTTTTGASTTPTTGTSTTAARTQIVSRFDLTAPGGATTPAGRAEVVKQGAKEGIVLVGSGLAANTSKNAYAVWLTGGGGSSKLLGFVKPAVASDGKLQTLGVLPANASSYKTMVVTLETVRKPTAPGKVVLQGTLGLK